MRKGVFIAGSLCLRIIGQHKEPQISDIIRGTQWLFSGTLHGQAAR
nr:MAG TPA: hypothetical protein [Caudoviricetes sp.]